MIPAPSSFTSLGEHLRDNHYEPKTLGLALLSYLNFPENQPSNATDSIGLDDIDELHHKWQYREIITQFIQILEPFVENPEDWET
ncbi:hypothetical protein [Runella zeae]|uniref:hypothetical protein n=1 Tax=Runella zeae TaxID=94255 RepID=UPI0023530871|nr:hypothetical protein [Runella zeae]